MGAIPPLLDRGTFATVRTTSAATGGRSRGAQSRLTVVSKARSHDVTVRTDRVAAGGPGRPVTSLRLAHSAGRSSRTGAAGLNAVSRTECERGEARTPPSNDVQYLLSQHRVIDFLALARRQKWDLKPVLQATGMVSAGQHAHCLGITKSGLTRLLRELWRSTGDDLLGLGTHPVPRGTFRMLGYALSSSPDLRSALARYAQFRSAVPGVPAITCVDDGETVTLAIESHGSGRADHAYTEAMVAVGHRIVNWAIGHPLPLIEVQLPRVQPSDAAQSEEYESLFGAPVRFSTSQAALLFASRSLGEPLGRTCEEVETFLDNAPLGLMTECTAQPSHAERVRTLLKAWVGCRGASADDIAAQVGMSRQTLHRRLRLENTSLVDIKNEVLRDEALQSLSRGEETIAALSQRLGFSEPAAFTRAFRRWTGVPPSVYRTRGVMLGTATTQ